MASKVAASGHPDRKLFLAMTGDYRPHGSLALTGKDGGPLEIEKVSTFTHLSDVELEQYIANLMAAESASGGVAQDT